MAPIDGVYGLPYPEMPPDLSDDLAKAHAEIARLTAERDVLREFVVAAHDGMIAAYGKAHGRPHDSVWPWAEYVRICAVACLKAADAAREVR